MSNHWTTKIAVFAAIAGAAWAQQPSGLTARELFYSPPPSGTAHKTPATAARATTPRHTAARRVTPKLSTPETASSQPAETTTFPTVPVVLASYSNAPLGLRYSVLKRHDGNSFQEVDPDTVFHSGDKIRLNVEANDSAYLYIVMRGSSGKWQPLFPSPKISGGDNRVERGKLYQIPPGNQGQFTFDENAGEEKLFLVLSRQPEMDFEKLIYSIGAGGANGETPAATSPAGPEHPKPLKIMMAKNEAPIDDDLVSRIRSGFISRDLVFEKVDDSTPAAKPGEKKETAVYVVNRQTGPGASLIVDLKLKHE
ncbi:MAG: DUF4384 domain-containing protein [Bryobacteraceae bacterium]